MTGNEYTRYAPTDVAQEALRYLDVVDVFATLNADPHAAARARAARARACEDSAAQEPDATERKGVLRWRS
jgi:putative ubiquitin-RnfH superfamily antitoxin RatB of RatAB toxin-antitoxin module